MWTYVIISPKYNKFPDEPGQDTRWNFKVRVTYVYNKFKSHKSCKSSFV